MKKLRKALISTLLFLMLVLFVSQNALASNETNEWKRLEYSQEYLDWLKLPEEKRKNILQPRLYEFINTKVESKNPFYMANMLKASFSDKYSLKDLIANNLKIRDQQQTNSCWAFATLSSLETNLALANKKEGTNLSKVYDFSERHMVYATSKAFANGVNNPAGYNKEVGAGGTFEMASSYLTNGSGAIDEAEMKFENNEDIIDISKIQNKTVTSHVYDTKEFPQYTSTDDKTAIKEHIQNYGSVYAGVHGAKLFTGDCYNNDTGAIYCNNNMLYPIDHAVSIIGWDDNYSKENFNEKLRPSSNGAWIVRNSWGEKIEESLAELRKLIFEANKQYCIDKGWTDPSLMEDEFVNPIIERNGYTIEGDIAYKKIGDNGIMYVSYEDCNIGKNLFGIVKATDSKDYENIYQYDEFYSSILLEFQRSQAMICNIFNKKTTGTEYLTQVSLYAPETYTCKVYVNPNGTSRAKKDLQLVSLKAGQSETFDAGYHTLEFAEPIEIKSNSFAVVVEIQGTRNNVTVGLESKIADSAWEGVKVESGKCFLTMGYDLDQCEWTDLGKMTELRPDLINGDSTIKAYTVSKIVDDSLKNIVIETPPTKTKYFVGENFNAAGMVVKANYNDGTSKVLDGASYSITNGTNLKEGQTSVKITYEDKSIEQPITVEKNSVTELKIITPPTKTEYKEGQNFDKTGMVVEAKYKDGTTKTITDYEIVDGTNLKADQKTVTIKYEGKTVTQTITVIENPLVEIKITKAPNKVNYVVGQNFDKTGMVVTGYYKDETSAEIVNYDVEDGTNLKADQKTVTIKYDGKTVTQAITVVNKEITEVSIAKKPTKLTYVQGKDDLDLTGGTLKVTYNDGTTESVAMTSEEVKVTGFNNSTLGKATIVLTYKSKEVQLEIEIIKENVVEERAENSNFDNATCNVGQVKAYFFTDKSKKEYILINTEINQILRNLNNDKNEYYFYLSNSKSEKNITDWVKITEKQDKNDKLQFTIDSTKIKNQIELAADDILYIYIKEVAIKGGDQSVAISKAMELKANDKIETYLDNVKQDNTKPDNNNSNDQKDDTIFGGDLPNTGKITVIALTSIILIAGTYGYIRYKKLNKYIK